MSEERKVYVVMQGEYSDRGICGVFGDRQLAEAFVAHLGAARSRDPMEIEEWPLNPHTDAVRAGLLPYYVKMSRNGDVYYVGRTPWSSESEDYFEPRGKDKAAILCCPLVWAKDEAGAAKIVNERRARLIAEGKWPEG